MRGWYAIFTSVWTFFDEMKDDWRIHFFSMLQFQVVYGLGWCRVRQSWSRMWLFDIR